MNDAQNYAHMTTAFFMRIWYKQIEESICKSPATTKGEALVVFLSHGLLYALIPWFFFIAPELLIFLARSVAVPSVFSLILLVSPCMGCDFFPLKKQSSFVFADLFCYLFVLKLFVRFPACVFLYVKAVQILVNMASLFSPNGGQHVGTGEPLLSNSPVKKLLRSAKRATVFVNRQLPLLTLGATAGGVVGVLAWYIREKDFMIVNLAKQLEKSRREKEELKQNLIKEQEELEEKLIEIAKLKEKNFRNLLKPAESPLFDADNNSASLTDTNGTDKNNNEEDGDGE